VRHAARIRHAVIGALAFAGVVLAADAGPGDGRGWTAVTNPKDVIAARGELMEELEHLMQPIDTFQVVDSDNLDALKLLQESYLNKVRLIYIDPPYNTGHDFVYDDDFAATTAEYLAKSGQADSAGRRLVANSESNGRFHSDWLSMMYPRLKLARNLLADDGVIFVSIDSTEHANLTRLLIELMGEENFRANIVWHGAVRQLPFSA